MVNFDPLPTEDSFEQQEELKGHNKGAAVFELSSVSEKEWHIREDEELLCELRLDGETVNSSTPKAVCCTLAASVAIGGFFIPCLCLGPCCIVPGIVRQGKTALEMKIFLTDKAIYAYAGDRDEHSRQTCFSCPSDPYCEGFPIRKRLEYERIVAVTTPPPLGETCVQPGGGYDLLQIFTKKVFPGGAWYDECTNLLGTNGQDPDGIYFPRVYHAEDVAKMIQFICEAKENEQEIDWESLKESMKDHVTLISDKSQIVGPQSNSMYE